MRAAPAPVPVPAPAASSASSLPTRRRLGACLAAAALWLAGCAAAPPTSTPAGTATPAAARAPVVVRLIAFNDFHGNLEAAPGLTLPWPDPAQPGRALRLNAGGAAYLAGTVKALRDGAAHSIVVESGDLFGGTPLVSALFRHEPTVDIANRIGVDVGIAGNHEFDAGADELLRVLRGGCRADAADAPFVSCARGERHPGAAFPVLAANVRRADGSLLLPASAVFERGGVKVGFIGAVTRSTPSIVVPSGVAGLAFGDEADAINAEAARLAAQGVRALVAVIHEGGETGTPGAPLEWNDAGCPQPRGAIFRLAQRLSPEVDLVLSAHTHQGYRCVVDGRAILQATALGRGVSVVDLAVDAASGEVDRARTRHRNLPVFNDRSDAALRAAITAAEPEPFAQALRAAVPDAAVAARVAAYVAAAAPLADRPVGRIAGAFDRAGRTDASAGRLIADAQWRATREAAAGGAQLALMNPGGVRADLRCTGAAPPPCAVTYGEAFTVQPFGNSLVVLSLSGAELRQLLEDQQRPGRAAPSFLIPSSSLTYRWLASAPHGARVADLRVGGRAVDPGETLRVTVNSFLADGGDGVAALTRGRDRVGGALDIDALAALLQTGPAPDPVPRITWVD